MDKATVFVGADHRGFELKEKLRVVFPQMVDVGRGLGDFAEDDFNDPARVVAKKILDGAGGVGVLICGTGVGMSMQANRFRGIRAVLARSEKDAELAREHNDANVLCLGADETTIEEAKKIVEKFLETKFLGEERYQRRNEKLDMGFFGEGDCGLCCGKDEKNLSEVSKEEK